MIAHDGNQNKEKEIARKAPATMTHRVLEDLSLHSYFSGSVTLRPSVSMDNLLIPF